MFGSFRRGIALLCLLFWLGCQGVFMLHWHHDHLTEQIGAADEPCALCINVKIISTLSTSTALMPLIFTAFALLLRRAFFSTVTTLYIDGQRAPPNLSLLN